MDYTPEKFKEKVAEYFAKCFVRVETKKKSGEVNVRAEQVQPYDVVSLAAFLGLDIDVLKDYRDRHDEIGDIAKEAFRTIEAYLNKKLITSGRSSGIQFYLREHFGYDKKAIDINVMHHWSDKELEAQLRMALETLAAAGEIGHDIIQLVGTGSEAAPYQLPERTGQKAESETS